MLIKEIKEVLSKKRHIDVYVHLRIVWVLTGLVLFNWLVFYSYAAFGRVWGPAPGSRPSTNVVLINYMSCLLNYMISIYQRNRLYRLLSRGEKLIPSNGTADILEILGALNLRLYIMVILLLTAVNRLAYLLFPS